MTNFKSGEKLLNQAQKIFKEVILAYNDKDFNRTVRRSQEVVELSLKGILKIMGIDYPKVHDVGGVFEEVIARREIELKEEEIEKIVEISTRLSEKRAPAFYFEEEFNLADAKQAKEFATFVLNTMNSLVKKLKKPK